MLTSPATRLALERLTERAAQSLVVLISLSLRFDRERPHEDRAIMEFIYKRQADRRNRGLA